MLGTIRASRGRSGAAATTVSATISAIRETLTLWRALARERRMLSSLDARLLRDIGIDPTNAETEAARPFWDAPANR